MRTDNIRLWSRFSLTTKILVVFLALTLVSSAILGIMASANLRGMGDYALESQSSLGERAIADSSAALQKLGEDSIKQKAEDVALQMEIYIKSHSDKTMTELQNDSALRSIAIQPVGQTGYTVALDLNDGRWWFHKFKDIFENKAAKDLLTDPASEYYRPEVWRLINQPVSTHQDSGGYYDWKDPDGSIRPKYLWFAIVDATTADGVRLFVAATTYIDEFSRPVKDTTEKIDRAISLSAGQITTRQSNMARIFTAIFLIVLMAVVGLAFWLARTISRPVLSITAAARAMEKGEISDEEISRLSRNQGQDEVAALSRVFAKMAAEVKARETKLKKQVEELKIEIDHSKKARQVAEITDTDYFQNLKQKAKELREKKGDG